MRPSTLKMDLKTFRRKRVGLVRQGKWMNGAVGTSENLRIADARRVEGMPHPQTAKLVSCQNKE